MSKSIQERVKHLENVVKSCCNRFFKLKEQVDLLQIEVDTNADSKTTFGNTNYTVLSSDKYVTTSVIFTSPRAVVLPLADSVNEGHEIVIADGVGAINGVNTLTINRAGSDLINGATSEVIAAPFGMRRLISDGVSSWNFDGGVARLGGATFTGNISAPNFKSQGLQTLTGVAWTGTTAPSGTANLSYTWQRNGNLVTVAFTGIYSVAGSGLTAVRIQLPTDMPTPIRPTGVATTASNKVYAGLGQISTSLFNLGTTLQPCFIVNNATDTTKFDVLCGSSSASALAFYLSISYFTS